MARRLLVPEVRSRKIGLTTDDCSGGDFALKEF